MSRILRVLLLLGVAVCLVTTAKGMMDWEGEEWEDSRLMADAFAGIDPKLTEKSNEKMPKMLKEKNMEEDEAHLKKIAHHPRQPWGPRMPPMMAHRPRTLSTRNLTNILTNAIETKNVLVLMMMVDSNTLLAYNSELPAGGLYKGRRGLLELAEACIKNVQVRNSTFRIVSVDEGRNTAMIMRTITGVARHTQKTFTARTLIIVKFSLQRIACIDFVDLDYATVKDALSTPAEKAMCHLAETWFTNGPLSPNTLALVADNFTLTFGAVSPKVLLRIDNKKALLHHLNEKEKSGACKLLECLKNHTHETLVLHADSNRVVSINFAGEVMKARKLIDRHSDGTIVNGVPRVDDKRSITVYFTLHEFDNDGKVTRVYVQLSRPLTILDRVHLRDVHGITIEAHHDE